MQFGMLFDAPAQPATRRDRAKPAARPAEPLPCATGQIALTLAAPEPAPSPPVPPQPAAPLPIVAEAVVAKPTVPASPPARIDPPDLPSLPNRPMRYVVQAFNRSRQGLVAEAPFGARDAAMACQRAEALAQRKAGVIAYAVPADAGEDDYPEARILARFGLCPETDD